MLEQNDLGFYFACAFLVGLTSLALAKTCMHILGRWAARKAKNQSDFMLAERNQNVAERKARKVIESARTWSKS